MVLSINVKIFVYFESVLRYCIRQEKPTMIARERKKIIVRILSLLEHEGNLHCLN